MTKLHELREKLAERNLELEDMITQVQRVAENMAEITRQQEILTAKMRVHNKMGELSALPASIWRRSPREKNHSSWICGRIASKRSGRRLRRRTNRMPVRKLCLIAKSIGVDVQIHGVMPEDDHTAYLLVVALRECVTNALHHAGGTRLDLTITHGERHVSAVYTNNGKQPTQGDHGGRRTFSLRERIGAGRRNHDCSESALLFTDRNAPRNHRQSWKRSTFHDACSYRR